MGAVDDAIKGRIRALLDSCGARYDWLEHERVFSMEECAPIGDRLGARHCKNLLLCNRTRTKYYLLMMADKPFRTALFARSLGVGRAGFVPGEDMPELLGVMPGSASPLALINDPQGRIRLVVDREVLGWSRVCVHPGDSTASLAMDTGELLRLCADALGHEYSEVCLEGETDKPDGNEAQ